MIENIDKNEIRRIVAKSPKDGSKRVRKGETKCKKEQHFRREESNLELLELCRSYWDRMAKIRNERRRNVRYKNGDQWSDTIEDPQNPGHYIKEESYITRDGKLALKHNIVGQISRNLVGQMLANPSQSEVFARCEDDQDLSEMLTNALNGCHATNNSHKLDIAIFEELIVSGIGCMKVKYGYIDQKSKCDGILEPVNINRLFFNSDIEDPRLSEINIIGQLHEYSFQEIVSAFANGSEDEKALQKIFFGAQEGFSTHQLGTPKDISYSFYQSNSPSKYRVVEIWRREWRWINHIHDLLDGTEQNTLLSATEIEEINNRRIEAAIKEGGDGSEIPLIEFYQKHESFWSVKFLSPTGHTLKSFESPYAHLSHPYILATMPMIDGEFRSYISDIVDMQRYINRLIVTLDSIMGSSAKGVLMLPEECIPDGYSIDDFAKEYVKSNGVIVYRPSNRGNTPQQIVNNSSPAGVWDMLKTQLQLIEQISGVSEAIQGQSSSQYTTASLYSQKASNSQLNYRILFDTLNTFIKDRDEKLLKILMQFYTEQRVVETTHGTDHKVDGRYWEPDLIDKIIDFNLVVTQSFDTPTFRMQFEHHLQEMLNNRYIDFELYLKNSTMPFASKLLSQIENSQKDPQE